MLEAFLGVRDTARRPLRDFRAPEASDAHQKSSIIAFDAKRVAVHLHKCIMCLALDFPSE